MWWAISVRKGRIAGEREGGETRMGAGRAWSRRQREGITKRINTLLKGTNGWEAKIGFYIGKKRNRKRNGKCAKGEENKVKENNSPVSTRNVSSKA